jgi:hypothetical protein
VVGRTRSLDHPSKPNPLSTSEQVTGDRARSLPLCASRQVARTGSGTWPSSVLRALLTLFHVPMSKSDCEMIKFAQKQNLIHDIL